MFFTALGPVLLNGVIQCTNQTCTSTFSVIVPDIMPNPTIPNNPCVNLRPDKQNESQGITFNDTRFCTSVWVIDSTNNSLNITFNISFDGQGWNYKYFLSSNDATANLNQLILDTQNYSNASNTSILINLTSPAPLPSPVRFCQFVGNRDYSAIFSDNGQCLPLVDSYTVNTDQSINLAAKSCFNQSLNVSISTDQIFRPVVNITSTTQHHSDAQTVSTLNGTFTNIQNVTVIITNSAGQVQALPVTVNGNQLVFTKQPLGRYSIMVRYSDLCIMDYNTTQYTLYVLTYRQYNQSADIVCSDTLGYCSQQFSLPNIGEFMTEQQLCQALYIRSLTQSQIKYNQFRCTYDAVTQTLQIDYVNSTIGNMSISLVQGSDILEDTSAVNTINQAQLTFLDVFDLRVGNVVANYTFDYSRLYCNLTSYADLCGGADSRVSVNKYQCGNPVTADFSYSGAGGTITCANANDPANRAEIDGQGTVYVRFSYQPCFGTLAQESVPVHLLPFSVSALNYTNGIQLLQNEPFRVVVTFFENVTAGRPIYLPGTTDVYLSAPGARIPYSSVTVQNGNIYTFDFSLTVNGSYTLHIDSAFDRCSQQYVFNYTQEFANITVIAFDYYEPFFNQSGPCIPPTQANSNYSSYVNENSTTLDYIYQYELLSGLYDNLTWDSNIDDGVQYQCSQFFTNMDFVNGMSKCDITRVGNNAIFSIILSGDFLLRESNDTHRLNALCFRNTSNTTVDPNTGNTMQNNMTIRSCLYTPDLIKDCVEYYNNTLTYCTAFNRPPRNLFYSNVTSIATADQTTRINVTLTSKWGQVLTNNFTSNHTILIQYISILDLYNCTTLCDPNVVLRVELLYSPEVSIRSVYLQGIDSFTAVPILQITSNLWESRYIDIDAAGNFRLAINYTDQCGNMFTMETNYTTQIIKNATYVFSNQTMYLNSFIYYKIQPQGFNFIFSYFNSSTSPVHLVGSSTNIPIDSTASSNTNITLNVRLGQTPDDTCQFIITIYHVNNTVYSRSTKGCNFTDASKEQGYLNQTLQVPINVMSAGSQLNYSQATLFVIIVDNYLDLNCSLTSGQLAATKPYRYRANYGYFARCKGVFTSLTSIQNGKTADNIYLTSIPTSISVLGCNSYKGCWETFVNLTQDALLDYNPSDSITSYADYNVLPLFMKNNIVRSLLVNQITNTQTRAMLLNYIFQEYQNCVQQKMASCHQGMRFPYTIEAYQLAGSISPQVQRLILNDFFSEEQLKFVRQLSGMLGSDYINNLVAFINVNPNSDTNLMKRHLEIITRQLVFDEGVQLGFNNIYSFQSQNGTFMLLLQDFMHCQEVNSLDFNGVRLDVATHYTYIHGCGDKLGQAVYLEEINGQQNIQVYGGGDQISLTSNSTRLRCAPGQNRVQEGNLVTCSGPFSNNQFWGQSLDDNSKLSTGEIFAIVLVCVLLVAGLVGLSVYLGRKYPCQCARLSTGRSLASLKLR